MIGLKTLIPKRTRLSHTSISHSISIPKLIHKLKWAGIGGPLLACIGALLTGRTQIVKVGSSYSELKSVSSGVPQGSVIGPMLFIFYINDIADEISPSSTHKLYADDLKAYNSGLNDKDGKKLSNILKNITQWANTWQLPISTEKSKWLLISNKPKPADEDLQGNVFQLAGVDLPNTTEVLDLGVNFNSKLNFSDHISSLISKAKQKLFLVKKIFVSKNPTILIMAFKTYVIPLLEHCSQIWNPHIVADVRRLESVQRLFTKRLPGFQGLGYLARLKKLAFIHWN
jgi:ribonuclease P/MRP protein subunit RPP40